MNVAGLLFESTVKASLVIVLALAAIACLRRQSAALRHWILSAAIVASLVAPVLGLVTPSWRIPLDGIPKARQIAMTASSSAAARAASQPVRPDGPRHAGASISTIDAGTLIAAVWIAGAAVSILIQLVGLGRVAWVGSPARPWAGGRGAWWGEAATAPSTPACTARS